jgi:hypothetical protein
VREAADMPDHDWLFRPVWEGMPEETKP